MVIDVTHTEAITKILQRKNLTKYAVTKMLHLNSFGTVPARMKGRGVRLCKLVELLDVLDYEMIVQPKSTEEPPEDIYVMDPFNNYNEGEST